MAAHADTSMPTNFKIALVQTCPIPNDPETNFKQAVSLVRQGAEQGANLAILPEYHLTAFEPSSPDFIPACQTSHHYVEKYQQLAKELNICIVPGTIVLTPEPEDPTTVKYDDGDATQRPTLLNTAYFIDNHGTVLGQYTKTNLWHPEREHLTSSIEHHYNQISFNDDTASPTQPQQGQRRPQDGEHPPSSHQEALPEPHQVLDTPLGKVGMLVCWDLAFPEAFRSLVMQGAEIILVPTYWVDGDLSPEGLRYNPRSESLFLSTTLVARAFENTAAVVFCNAGGPQHKGMIGLSQVALPIVGAVDGSFADAEVGLRVVEVDMRVVRVAEENYKVREDLARSDWHYGYARQEIAS